MICLGSLDGGYARGFHFLKGITFTLGHKIKKAKTSRWGWNALVHLGMLSGVLTLCLGQSGPRIDLL